MIAFPQIHSLAATLSCPVCKKEYDITSLQTYATCCNQPLLTQYQNTRSLQKELLLNREKNLWRYFEMLPVFDRNNIVTLGEGMTPLLRLTRTASRYRLPELWVKDESANPTGSFKARGISMAVSKMKELGVEKCIVPTAGNAGGALAAYCAKANIKCTVVMPRHTPVVFKRECKLYDAELILTDGLINDCAAKAKEINQSGSYFDVSTLKEPYRLEGKKTMGYEIAEQFHWRLPDAIVYPAGGGTGLIGIWKALRELKQMGWITGPLPKMIAVQSEVCDPVIRALDDYNNWKKDFHPQPSIANGLAVPYPFGMDLMLKTIKESGGTAVAVTEDKIMETVQAVAREEGILLSPEGAAAFAALPMLLANDIIQEWDKIVVLNTGSGYKYLENLLY